MDKSREIKLLSFGELKNNVDEIYTGCQKEWKRIAAILNTSHGSSARKARVSETFVAIVIIAKTL